MFKNIEYLEQPILNYKSIKEMKVLNLWELAAKTEDENARIEYFEQIAQLLEIQDVNEIIEYIGNLLSNIEKIFPSELVDKGKAVTTVEDTDTDCFSILVHVPKYILQQGILAVLCYYNKCIEIQEKNEYRLYHIIDFIQSTRYSKSADKSNYMRDFERVFFKNLTKHEEKNYPDLPPISLKEALENLGVTLNKKE